MKRVVSGSGLTPVEDFLPVSAGRASVGGMGGKPRSEDPRVHSSMTRRPVVAPKLVASPTPPASEKEGAVAVSIHDEVTRNYAVDPPTE